VLLSWVNKSMISHHINFEKVKSTQHYWRHLNVLHAYIGWRISAVITQIGCETETDTYRFQCNSVTYYVIIWVSVKSVYHITACEKFAHYLSPTCWFCCLVIYNQCVVVSRVIQHIEGGTITKDWIISLVQFGRAITGRKWRYVCDGK